MSDADIFFYGVFVIFSLCMLIWNLKLTAEKYSLKKELYQRQRWYLRELAKLRQRL